MINNHVRKPLVSLNSEAHCRMCSVFPLGKYAKHYQYRGYKKNWCQRRLSQKMQSFEYLRTFRKLTPEEKLKPKRSVKKNKWLKCPVGLTISDSTQCLNSVAQSCLTLCNPKDCSAPGLPVHHQLPEFTQTHVCQVSDAIQPSQPLSSPSPPTFNLSQHQGLGISFSHQVTKVLELQLQNQSLQWIFRTDLLWGGLVGSPCSPRDSQESSHLPQFKSINSSVLSFLYSPVFTSIHGYWKNHSLD